MNGKIAVASCCIVLFSISMYEYDEDLYGEESSFKEVQVRPLVSEQVVPEQTKIIKINYNNRALLPALKFSLTSNFSIFYGKPKGWFNDPKNYFGVMVTVSNKPVGFIVARLIDLSLLYILKIHIAREYRLMSKEELLLEAARSYFNSLAQSLGYCIIKVKIVLSLADCYLEDALRDIGMARCITKLNSLHIVSYEADIRGSSSTTYEI